MEVATGRLLALLGGAGLLMLLGYLLQTSRARVLGWLLGLAGAGITALLAAMMLTGRLGPAQLWFRTPAFAVASALLLAAVAWWFFRPVSRNRWVRFGIPAVGLVLLVAAGTLMRLGPRATPLAAYLPTLRAGAPPLTYFDAGGRRRDLAALSGRPVLVNFWATWCVPCRSEMPLLSRMQSEYRSKGLVVLFVSLEEPAALEEFWRHNDFAGERARLASADDYYHAGKIYPLSYLISRDGHVVERWKGRPAENWLREVIDAEL